MYRSDTERKVWDKLQNWFGRRQVDQMELVKPGVYRARLVDGGLAYATVEADGSVSIQELEAVC